MPSRHFWSSSAVPSPVWRLWPNCCFTALYYCSCSNPSTTEQRKRISFRTNFQNNNFAHNNSNSTDHNIATNEIAAAQQQSNNHDKMADESPRFPCFGRLPPEIRAKIFTQAIRKPNIHFIRGKRTYGQTQFGIDFFPVSKGQDKSGYRLLEVLDAVNDEAAMAVRHATQRHQAKLPFKKLVNRIDEEADLVCLQFPSSRFVNNSSFFHPDLQAINPLRFDANALESHVRPFQRVAFVWSATDSDSSSLRAFFRCSDQHPEHAGWKMCPDELRGFLDCFPSLREVYVILKPSKEQHEQEVADTYCKNFFSRKFTSSLPTGSDRLAPHYTTPHFLDPPIHSSVPIQAPHRSENKPRNLPQSTNQTPPANLPTPFLPPQSQPRSAGGATWPSSTTRSGPTSRWTETSSCASTRTGAGRTGWRLACCRGCARCCGSCGARCCSTATGCRPGSGTSRRRTGSAAPRASASSSRSSCPPTARTPAGPTTPGAAASARCLVVE